MAAMPMTALTAAGIAAVPWTVERLKPAADATPPSTVVRVTRISAIGLTVSVAVTVSMAVVSIAIAIIAPSVTVVSIPVTIVGLARVCGR